MATRPIYKPSLLKVGVETQQVDFHWSPGMSFQQKQKSIRSLHENAKILGAYPILEISSKSSDELGVKLSAFNLKIESTKLKLIISVEVAFQASKIFEKGGPFTDLLGASSVSAKKDPRIRNSGDLIGFDFLGQKFDIKPRTLFYDWIYINALNQNDLLAHELLGYAGFSDIEFNPKKSINCQAYAAALYVSLYKNNYLDIALSSQEEFSAIMKDSYRLKDSDIMVQGKLF